MEANIDILRALVALVFVLGLIWILGLGMRRYGWRFGLPVPRDIRNKRLSLVEIMPLDNKNKLVIIRRDNSEHLLLIGAEQAQIIEKGIRANHDCGTLK